MNVFSAFIDDDDVKVKKSAAPAKAASGAASGNKAPTRDTPRAVANGDAGAGKVDNRASGKARGERKNKERGQGRAVKSKGDGEPRNRQFDRRQAEGHGKGPRKQGGGPGGWGKASDEAARAEKQGIEDDVDDVEAVADEGDSPEPEAPPAPDTFTYEEFLARQQQSRSDSNLFGDVSERKANSAEFSGIMKEKKELPAYMDQVGGKKQRGKTSQRSNSKKELGIGFDLALESPYPEREREERPSRGGGRTDRAPRRNDGARKEGGGRGKDHGGRGGGADRGAPRAPRGGMNLADEAAFPALG